MNKILKSDLYEGWCIFPPKFIYYVTKKEKVLKDMTTAFNFYWLNLQVFILWKNVIDEIESSQLGFSLWNKQHDSNRICKIKTGKKIINDFF